MDHETARRRISTRDVQHALVTAQPHKFGIADSSVNGHFGPATQTGPRVHPRSQGGTGIFVQLYPAACVEGFADKLQHLTERS